jgi:hypothetical protein
MRTRPLFSRAKRTFFTGFSVAFPQVMARVGVPQKGQFTIDHHITSPLLLPLTPIAFKIEG